MTMVKFEGWHLPTPGASSIEGPPGHFFLNTHLLVSADPVAFADQAGYLLTMENTRTYFVVMGEAEMSMLFQMAR